MAQNAAAERFCKSLFAAVGGRVNADTRTLYQAKLSKWVLPADDWAKALSRLVADLKSRENGDVILPPLGDVYAYLEGAKSFDSSRGKVTHWLTFDLRGHRQAIRVADPAHPPELPPGGSDPHLVIDPECEYHESEPQVARERCNRMQGVGEIIASEVPF